MAIEGIDGSGKTTQAKILVDRLNKIGSPSVYVSPVFVLLNFFKIAKKDGASRFSPRKSRTKHTDYSSNSKKKSTKSMLGYFWAYLSYAFIKVRYRNKIVVCDRYFYQFFYDLFGGENKLIQRFPKPNMVFFLKGDLNLFYSRMTDLSDASVNAVYYQRVLSFYNGVLDNNCFMLNANCSKDAISDEIFNTLQAHVSKNV